MSHAAGYDAVAFRLSALGDVALTTGVLEHWRQTRNMRFACITRERFAPLFAGHPAVAEVVALSDAAIRARWMKLCARLNASFGHAPLIDLHGTGRALLLTSMWSAKVHRYPKKTVARRLYNLTGAGFARRSLEALNVPQRYSLALDECAPEADRLVPRLFVSEDERAKAREMLDKLGTGRPLVALHPYATHVNKAWPKRHWSALADGLDAAGVSWIVIGRDPTPFLAERANGRDLTGATSLRATIALLDACDALVTGDSGPMHLAAGVDTPVTALFGPTTRAWGFYPAGTRDTVLEREIPCRPCSLHGGAACKKDRACLADIVPDEVLAALERTLS